MSPKGEVCRTLDRHQCGLTASVLDSIRRYKLEEIMKHVGFHDRYQLIKKYFSGYWVVVYWNVSSWIAKDFLSSDWEWAKFSFSATLLQRLQSIRRSKKETTIFINTQRFIFNLFFIVIFTLVICNFIITSRKFKSQT